MTYVLTRKTKRTEDGTIIPVGTRGTIIDTFEDKGITHVLVEFDNPEWEYENSNMWYNSKEVEIIR